jgi:hypothetical protein
MSVKSVMQAPSFKPELEFEIIKLVLLREKYLQRLSSKLEQKKGRVDMGIIGIVDVLRDCSVEIVETVQTWERTQVFSSVLHSSPLPDLISKCKTIHLEWTKLFIKDV